MGVHGLWELLSPVGIRVSNEHVSGKVLAVDISIWLTQFVKAMRDTEGAQVRNAHLLGVFRRCIKLLFLSVRPVLIFDGATPAIKRRTLASRRAQRERHAAKLRKLAENLILNQMRTKAINIAISNSSALHRQKKTLLAPAISEQPPVLDHASDEDKIEPVNNSNDDQLTRSRAVARVSWADKQFRPNDQSLQGSEYGDEDRIEPVFRLKEGSPPLHANMQGQETAGQDEVGFSADELADHEEVIAGIPPSETIALPYDLDDIDDETLMGLPHNLQADIFKQIKMQQRAKHRERMMLKKNDPSEFSKTQIDGFLKNTALNRKISSVRSAINSKSGASQRIASDSARQFFLKETESAKTGNSDASDFEDDSDDNDILSTSPSQRKKNNIAQGIPDILARIRANRDASLNLDRNEEDRKLKSVKAKQQNRSGVGWASKVLEGQGGHQLGGRSSLGNFLQNESIETPSSDDSIQECEAPGKKEESNQSEEDMEWEDGNMEEPEQTLSHMRFAPSRSTSEGNKFEREDDDARLKSSGVWQEHNGMSSFEARNGFIDGVKVLPDNEKLMQDNKGPRKDPLSAENENSTENAKLSEAKNLDDEKRKRKRRQMILDDLDFEEERLQSIRCNADAVMKCATASNPDDSISAQLKSQRGVIADLDYEEELLHPSNVENISSDRENRKAIPDGAALNSVLPIPMSTSRNSLEKTIGTSGMLPTTSANKITAKDVDTDSGKAMEADRSLSESRAATEEEKDVQLAIQLSLQVETPSTSWKEDGLDSCRLDRKVHASNDCVESDKSCFPVISTGSQIPAHTEQNIMSTANQTTVVERNAVKETLSDVTASAVNNGDALIHKAGPDPIETTEKDSDDPSGSRDGQDEEGEEMSPGQMQDLRDKLEHEAQGIRKKRTSHQGGAETLSDEMYSETRDLLKLLGIPYLEAPTEAEAQCAFLDMENVVDGIITEDSDAFLFGARTVYRRLFSEGHFAEAYNWRDIEKNLGLNRELLIRLAYLLGSDYTAGVRGVGVVNSMEILEAFPGEGGLVEFRKWTESVTVLDEEPGEEVMKGASQIAVRRRFCWKHRNMKRNWEIREGFPNGAVAEAYRKPDIDTNKGRFRWGAVDFIGLGLFCWEKFGWERDTFETAVGPLRKKLKEVQGAHQMKIDDFFRPHRFAKIRSERLQTAVRGMAGDNAKELMAELQPRIGKRKRLPVAHLPPDVSDEESELIAAVERVERREQTDGKSKRNRRKS